MEQPTWAAGVLVLKGAARIELADRVLSLKAWFSVQRKEDDFFSSHRADVVMHTQHFASGRFVDYRFQHRASHFEQLLSCLLDEIPPFFC